MRNNVSTFFLYFVKLPDNCQTIVKQSNYWCRKRHLRRMQDEWMDGIGIGMDLRVGVSYREPSGQGSVM